MTKRYDVVTPRPKYQQQGVWWHRVGSAFENDEGRITIYLDSVPVPDPEKENKIVMMLFEPKPKDGEETKGKKPAKRGTTKGKPAIQQRSLAEELDDEIPF